MKIKVKNADYKSVMEMERPKHKKPKRPNIFFRTLMKVLSVPTLWKNHFTLETECMAGRPIHGALVRSQ